MDKRLVKVVGRSEEVGKPVLYGTTTEFLEVFNLANVDQLPPEHELEEVAKQGVGKISDIRNLINADIQSRFENDEIDELDKLSFSIKSVQADTPFTKSLKVEEKKRGKEGEVCKTAFELLEEYLDKNLVSRENKESVLSEVFTAITEASVINDLTKGPFNTPEEVEEEFEMIDLDTGLPVVEESENSEESSEESNVEEVKLLDPEVDEAKELAKALDEAFSKMMGGESLLDEVADDVEVEDNIDEMTSKMVEDAKDFDLDLSFLKDESPENPEETNS